MLKRCTVSLNPFEKHRGDREVDTNRVESAPRENVMQQPAMHASLPSSNGWMKTKPERQASRRHDRVEAAGLAFSRQRPANLESTGEIVRPGTQMVRQRRVGLAIARTDKTALGSPAQA